MLFTVVDEDLMPVLRASASQHMGLITINRANIRQVTEMNREADILEKYKDVFNDDVGHFPGEAHLEVDATIKPVIIPARKIPFALRPRLKDELDQLTEKGVIAPVNEPTEWVRALGPHHEEVCRIAYLHRPTSTQQSATQRTLQTSNTR